MKKIIISTTVFILFACTARAQQTESIVSAGGGVSKGSNGVILEWTLGEPIIEMAKTAARLYTAGFHQPYIAIKEVTAEAKVADAIQVFPNPVNDRLLVQLPPSQTEQVRLILSDLTGHSLIERQLSGKSGQTELSMRGLAGGVYQLRVMKMDGTITKVYKVIKL